MVLFYFEFRSKISDEWYWYLDKNSGILEMGRNSNRNGRWRIKDLVSRICEGTIKMTNYKFCIFLSI